MSKTADARSSLANKIYVPHSEKEYRQLVSQLDSLIDEVGENESTHQKYEDEHVWELAVD